jgi:hypothetical protein
MIDADTKQKFLKELEKSGNVYFAAYKVGISRDSHYRWKKEDPEYCKLATLAEKRGRENNCDVAEHALMILVKDQDLSAIKYLLSRNSPRYKSQKTSKVVIEHRTTAKMLPVPEKTIEDLFYQHAEARRKEAEGG